MSNSVRHSPVTANTTCRSEHREKRFCNRALRRAVRVRLSVGNWEVLPLAREIGNVWCWGKDGKGWVVADSSARHYGRRWEIEWWKLWRK